MNRDAKFYLRTGIAVLFVLLIGGYAFYQARKFIGGPEITVSSPKDGAALTDPLVDIQGIALNISAISLDDRPIFIDKVGHFDEKLLLSPGYTIITLKASDKFGHKTEKTLELTYNGPSFVPSEATSTVLRATASSSSESSTTTATSTP